MRYGSLGALLLLSAHCLAAEEPWKPFVLQSFDGRTMDAELAILPVRENRTAANSRFIRVAAVRLPSSQSREGDAPVVFLSGGPGIPATILARVPVYFDLFDRLREVGDVILVDQRGTGMSLPNLSCPPKEMPRDFASSDEAMLQALRQRVAHCSSHWRSAGLDLSAYSTREIAHDVEIVRRAAGAERVKLLAFSYGSEVAFEILRRWPDTVERVVFASARAPDTLLKSPAEWDRQLERLGRLASMPIQSELQAIVSRLDSEPVNIEVEGQNFRVGGIGVLTILRGDLSDGRAIPTVPSFLRSIQEQNHQDLGTRIQKLHASFSNSFNIMPLAVDCSSGWSRDRLDRMRREASSAIMRNVNLQWQPEICDLLAPRARPASSGDRIHTSSLFVTGTLDPNAPIAQTDEIRRRFAHSSHVLVENGAHETLPLAAVQQIVLKFLQGFDVPGEVIVAPSPFKEAQ